MKEQRLCRYDGCESLNLYVQGFCQKHYRLLSKRKESGGVGRRPQGAVLSEEVRADIVRRMRRFESPSSIAKDLGINVKTVLLAMKAKP